MNMKVSVIIPVYNAEKYITECVGSLLNQTLKQCEFIFVNDGSTDQSGTIIEEFKKKDSRIILINQENQGVSIARNNGLKIASGEYVGFVDADDYIEIDMFETMYHAAKENDCDTVVSNFERELDGHFVKTRYIFPYEVSLTKKYISEEIIPYFLKTEDLNSIWNKIYRNKIIKQNNLRFPPNIDLGEDARFNIHFFSIASSAKFIDYCGYHYREVLGSATRDISKKDYFQKALEEYTLEIPEIEKFNLDKRKIKKLKSIKLINSVLSYIHLYFTPSNGLSIREKFNYVSYMIKSDIVREALQIYNGEYFSELGRYEKVLIKLVEKNFIIGLYVVTAYSRVRNNRGIL